MSEPDPLTDLVVSTYTPTVDRGRSMRTYGVIAAIAHHRRVEVLFKPFGDLEPSPAYGRLDGVSLQGVPSGARLARAVLYGRARLHGVPPADARGLSPELARACVRAVATPGRGRVIADGPSAAALLARSGLDFVYLAHNFESGLRPALPRFRQEYGSVRALRRFEGSLLNRARESWMASRRDVELARALAPQARLRYVPNVVDVSTIAAAAPAHRSPRALFVGDFSYPPNVNALRFLTDEVMPPVWSKLPEAELVVAGHSLTLPAGTDSRIRPLGYVERIDDAYDQTSCVVVPLLEGGGSPLKFVEALAHGLPVVATGAAAAGLEVTDGVHYRRGDGAQGFADSLSEVMRDGGWEIADNGRRLAERAYSVEALAAILDPTKGQGAV
jgi:glycosyltransferase involved in cell wall biosynthesis